MAFNGSGTYVLPGAALADGQTISATEHNTLRNDMATALTTCVTRDGQSPATANLPMGGFKHTGVAVASALTDYARTDQTQNSAFQWLTGVSGADTITATASPVPSAYAAGQIFRFVSVGANTGAVTLNISSLGAKAITKNGTTALVAGDIPSGAIVEVLYDGTRFQLGFVGLKIGDIGVTVQAYAATASQAEMEAGTEAAVRAMSPLRVAQAIAALAPAMRAEIVTFTRDTATASGTQVVTTTFEPTAIVFIQTTGAAGSFSVGFSTGSSGNYVIADAYGITANTWTANNGACLKDNETGSNIYIGAVSAKDATSFTITWTKTGTPTGTMNCAAICLK